MLLTTMAWAVRRNRVVPGRKQFLSSQSRAGQQLADCWSQQWDAQPCVVEQGVLARARLDLVKRVSRKARLAAPLQPFCEY